MTTTPLQLRLSPSGPPIGNPPSLVGGGSSVAGRVWVAQGVGAATTVPGTPAGSMLGLDSVPVNLLPSAQGYKYDIELDTQTFGDVGTSGGYDLLVLGSTDGGVTFPTTLAQIPDSIVKSGCGRMQVTNATNPNATAIDHVRCQIKSLLAANPAFNYSPTATALRITENSPGLVL